FSGGRRNARIQADDDAGSLSFEQTSFTAEVWVKTAPVTQSVALLERARASVGDLEAYRIVLDASGALRGYISGTVNGVASKAEAIIDQTAFDIDDDQWHLVAMVVDREAKVLRLYVDGVERKSVGIADGFRLTVRADHRLRAGFNGTATIIDELRIVNQARTVEQIRQTWFGATTTGSLAPQRSSTSIVANQSKSSSPPPKATGKNSRAGGGRR
ncbi:MAG TPA: LamG domain-containing protein, partial [Blastocatellia bacterium]